MAEVLHCKVCSGEAQYFVWYENCGGLYTSLCLEHLKFSFATDSVTFVRAVQDATYITGWLEGIPRELMQEMNRWKDERKTGQWALHWKDGAIVAATVPNNLRFTSDIQTMV